MRAQETFMYDVARYFVSISRLKAGTWALLLTANVAFAAPDGLHGSQGNLSVPVAPPVALGPLQSPHPVPRSSHLPRARWELQADGPLWTRVTLTSVRTHGKKLVETVPSDIADWCPSYPGNGERERAAFWVALISTLSRYESTWRAGAVGGGGLWHGLMQILPSTAALRDCRVQTGTALRHGPSNLSCAVRIMAVTVPRDGAIAIQGERRWQGVAADWGPIRTSWMRRDMQRYTRRQTFCRPLADARPKPRPEIGTSRETD